MEGIKNVYNFRYILKDDNESLLEVAKKEIPEAFILPMDYEATLTKTTYVEVPYLLNGAMIRRIRRPV